MGDRNAAFPRERKGSRKATILRLLEGDISLYDGDGVVNAANDHLWMGSGVAGALKRRGGSVIEKEAMARGPLSLGDVALTGGGALPASQVLHAVVMGQDLATSEAILRRATRRTLDVASEKGLTSLAFPALGTGVGGFPLADCADLMLDETLRWIDGHPGVLVEVAFVLYGTEAFHVWQKAFEARGL